MDSTTLTAIIAASTSIAVAFVSYYLQKRLENEKLWRDERLSFYRELMRSMSHIVKGNEEDDGHKRFTDCCNIAPLLASVDVVRALYKFRHILRARAAPAEREMHDEYLTTLVDAIRRDLGVKGALQGHSLEVRVWASAPIESSDA